MMTCREVIEALGDYLEHRTDSARTRIVAAHLDSCPECFYYFNSYKTTVMLARKEFKDAPAPSLGENTVREILDARRRRS